jgi:adenylylsulfate kinase-like enzyme
MTERAAAPPRPGAVYWLTGLSGAGKTTIGALLRDRLREQGVSCLLLDGDRLRMAIDPEAGHDSQTRRNLAFAYARLCHEIAGQGVTVVCATISMFHAVRDWNRDNIPGYYEIYLRVPFDQRQGRDPKGLYRERKPDMVGADGPFEEPRNPDMIIENFGDVTAAKAADLIWRRFIEGADAPVGPSSNG